MVYISPSQKGVRNIEIYASACIVASVCMARARQTEDQKTGSWDRETAWAKRAEVLCQGRWRFGGGDLAVNGPFSEYRTSPSSSSRYFSQTSPENRCFNAPGAVLQAEVGVHPCSPGIGEIGEKDTHDSTCFLSPFAHYLIIIIIYHHYPFISDGFVFALQNPFRWVSWWKVLDRIIRLSQSDHPKLCSIVQLCKTVKSWCEATNAQQREKVRSLEWSKSHG